MSSYKLTFTLKQHTPIIHFQADQEGATLRATEVKPKLDRFILTKLGNGNYEQGMQRARAKGWLVGKGEKPALNYKMRIEKIAENEKRGRVVIIPPDRDHWILSKGVRVTITTFNNEIMSILSNGNGKPSQLLIDFFNITNFGKRSSKGFGAFYIENDIKRFEDSLKSYYNGRIYVNNKIIYKEPCDDENPVFFYEKIHREWMRLKSGKNFNGYEKSRVFEYLSSKRIRWGKRWIKRKLNELINDGKLPHKLLYTYDPIDYKGQNSWKDLDQAVYRYGRAMLGLAELYEFLTISKNYKYQVIVDGGDIERFKSPITFKVFGKNVYVLIDGHPYKEEFIQAPFKFYVHLKKKVGKDWVKTGKTVPINGNLLTPSAREFNLIDFTKGYISDIGFNPL